MKVLVATRRSQGARRLDFDDCVEGELVWIATPCGRGLAPDHSYCSCSITFVGVASFGMTTTAMVTDLEAMTPERYEESLADALHCVRGLDGHVAETAAGLAGVAEVLPVGTVLERFNSWLQPRFDPETSALNPSILDLPELHD
ncbi:hypothetical protein [Amnibacterium sp.]|uniref:DUF7715 family protein n=1 Tax=Amnibacterium sp. TaxID=1872496 RepID=UPI00263141C0|nr:hypothetical protein [Amnibacterium sp.]MCU1475149.1 hypothetical protein [Amnibacterium sp.]